MDRIVAIADALSVAAKRVSLRRISAYWGKNCTAKCRLPILEV